MAASAARVFARLSTGEPPAGTKVVLGTAVVLGGSIAGLLAARVLSDHAENVVIVERDEPGQAMRDGVPQGGQVHVLLEGGRVQLERFFPAICEQACAEGAVLSLADDNRAYQDGVEKVRGDESPLLSSTRPFLESLIRRRALELPNVKVVTGRARDLVIEDGVVTGVRCSTEADQWIEHADFVVDAMGRSSRLGDWLVAAGWERPAMRRMTINVNYATGFFRREEAEPAISTSIAWHSPGAVAPKVSVGALGAVEDGRWMVLLAGFGDQRPGRTLEEFRRLAGSELPPLYGAAASGELIGDILTYHQTDSRRRDFHLLNRLPGGLISVGDAVASFNPVYGQGMSSAALHASCLSEYLRSGPAAGQVAREFFATQQVVVDAAWLMSTSADLARPDVDGPYPRGYRLSAWLSGQIVAASVVDKKVAARFTAVTFMSKHPSTLMSPALLLRAIRANRRKGNRRASQTMVA